jgi:glutathione synthase
LIKKSVIYFRSGYTPNDYPSEDQWEARLMMERSKAIKCPNIAYHLCGTKKIQQVLTEKKNLTKYCSEEEIETLKEVFTGIYSLKKGENEEIINEAIQNNHKYLLKPQR